MPDGVRRGGASTHVDDMSPPLPRPQLDEIIDPAWGQLVADKLNTTAQLFRAADVSLNLSNGQWATALSGAVGPCGLGVGDLVH